MAPRCDATTASGAPCAGAARPGRMKCWAHDPELQQKAKDARAAGGKGSARIVRVTKGLPAHLLTLREDLLECIRLVKALGLDPRAGEAIAKLSREVLEIDRFGLETFEAKAMADRLAELETEIKEIAG